MNVSQLKLQVYASCKKDEKKTTDSEPSNNEDVINKSYLHEKLLKKSENVNIPSTCRDYKKFSQLDVWYIKRKPLKKIVYPERDTILEKFRKRCFRNWRLKLLFNNPITNCEINLVIHVIAMIFSIFRILRT